MHVYIHTWNIEWNSQVNSSALCQSSLLLLGQLIKNNLQDQIPGDKKIALKMQHFCQKCNFLWTSFLHRFQP